MMRLSLLGICFLIAACKPTTLIGTWQQVLGQEGGIPQNWTFRENGTFESNTLNLEEEEGEREGAGGGDEDEASWGKFSTDQNTLDLTMWFYDQPSPTKLQRRMQYYIQRDNLCLIAFYAQGEHDGIVGSWIHSGDSQEQNIQGQSVRQGKSTITIDLRSDNSFQISRIISDGNASTTNVNTGSYSLSNNVLILPFEQDGAQQQRSLSYQGDSVLCSIAFERR